ncbi:MAG: type VI secretion system ATPase TssH, partial [Candidatus Accumulibacter sp.]|nr:type VI secretion system ATPase TssH [Accumulibacter sp.]
MRFDKLTTKFQQALADAQSLAVGHDNQMIEPQHLLLALLQQDDAATAPLLARAGVNVAALKAALTQAIGRLPKVEGNAGEVQIGRDLGNLLNLADKQAQKRGDQFIASEMFLLALCDDKGECGRLAKQHGLVKSALEQAVASVRGGQGVDNQEAEGQRQALAKYCIDLTDRARQGKLDPV